MIGGIFKSRPKIKKVKRAKKAVRLEWSPDSELTERVRTIVDKLEFVHIPKERIFCFRTEGSKARAYARTWAFPKIFQRVLEIEPAYVIEVISKYYDRENHEGQTRILIHELLHIPKNFSGSLLPHRHGRNSTRNEVERLYKQIKL